MRILSILTVILLASSSMGMVDAPVVLDQTYATPAGVNTTNTDALIGSGCWQANGTAKSSVYLPTAPYLGSFTVADIEKIEWNTKTGVVDNYDWYMTIYTVKDGVNDDGSWYGRRLTLENLYANSRNEVVGSWNNWSTDEDGSNVVTFYDGNRTNYGFYNGPTLTDIQNPAFTWASYPTSGSTAAINYANEQVLSIVFETGSGWASQYTGLIDGVTVSLKSGCSVTYDLEVPEPATLGLLLIGLPLLRRRR